MTRPFLNLHILPEYATIRTAVPVGTESAWIQGKGEKE